MRQSWETVRPGRNFKPKYNDNKHQKNEVMSLLKEGTKQIFNAKKIVHATENKKDNDSDFEIEDFF
jgi:hypothetical protein